MKRALDLVISLSALVVVLPVLLVIALLVRSRLGAPVFFAQERPGRRGRLFTIWKFRTMTDVRNADGTPRPDAERLTSLGRWLRATSADELPELWNVVRGDMSLVGPRPLLVEYLGRYSSEQARRHEVRPGLTGWAQVNGRNATTWGERLRFDVWYVDHRTLLLDLRIVVLTVVQVLCRKGINSPGSATMPEFTGATPESAAHFDPHG
jgi:lipopolysaccharide/colanic/teichoic acid biosynthesis glycosyltransferase